MFRYELRNLRTTRPGFVRPSGHAMRAIINTVHESARRFIDDGWLPVVLFAAVMLVAFLER
jgi:hypothetical protein